MTTVLENDLKRILRQAELVAPSQGFILAEDAAPGRKVTLPLDPEAAKLLRLIRRVCIRHKITLAKGA